MVVPSRGLRASSFRIQSDRSTIKHGAVFITRRSTNTLAPSLTFLYTNAGSPVRGSVCSTTSETMQSTTPETIEELQLCQEELYCVPQGSNRIIFSAQDPFSDRVATRANALSAVPVGVSFSTAFSDLTGNHAFMCAFLSWLVAQVAKIFTAYYREGRWDYRVMFDSGGMPSSHTALVVGLTTSISHQHGLGSVHFPMSLAFTLIVMYDAAGVRRHAEKQAEVLNKILSDTFQGSPLSNTKLKEVLGHSPLQVVCGAILGVLVASFYMLKFS